jgi:hypothetical protein
MSQWAAETSPFGLSRRAADSVKIEFFYLKKIFLFSIFRKILLFSELKILFLEKNIFLIEIFYF